jgi:hypothetical protein
LAGAVFNSYGTKFQCKLHAHARSEIGAEQFLSLFLGFSFTLLLVARMTGRFGTTSLTPANLEMSAFPLFFFCD